MAAFVHRAGIGVLLISQQCGTLVNREVLERRGEPMGKKDKKRWNKHAENNNSRIIRYCSQEIQYDACFLPVNHFTIFLLRTVTTRKMLDF